MPQVKGTATGCLGSCGSGPNVVLLPQKQLLHHVATPTDVTEVLRVFCGSAIEGNLLEATQLRLTGNAHAAAGQLDAAIAAYSAGLALQPPAGAHLLLANRSAAHLQAGQREEALADAAAAVEAAPPGFHSAAVRLVDALYALGRTREAAEACRRAAAADSSFRFRPEFKSIKMALQQAGETV